MNDIGMDVPCLENPREKYKALMIGIILVMPLSVLAAVHGQTMWTDDAAEILDRNMEDSEDFLFIHEATLGMHYLYTFHTGIDNVDKRNITGHWRSPDSGWQDELADGVEMENRGDLSNVEWVVLSPDVEWDAPDGWYFEDGQADFMNGGGTWKVYTTHEEISVH